MIADLLFPTFMSEVSQRIVFSYSLSISYERFLPLFLSSSLFPSIPLPLSLSNTQAPSLYLSFSLSLSLSKSHMTRIITSSPSSSPSSIDSLSLSFSVLKLSPSSSECQRPFVPIVIKGPEAAIGVWGQGRLGAERTFFLLVNTRSCNFLLFFPLFLLVICKCVRACILFSKLTLLLTFTLFLSTSISFFSYLILFLFLYLYLFLLSLPLSIPTYTVTLNLKI